MSEEKKVQISVLCIAEIVQTAALEYPTSPTVHFNVDYKRWNELFWVMSRHTSDFNEDGRYIRLIQALPGLCQVIRVYVGQSGELQMHAPDSSKRVVFEETAKF